MRLECKEGRRKSCLVASFADLSCGVLWITRFFKYVSGSSDGKVDRDRLSKKQVKIMKSHGKQQNIQ